MDNSDLHKELDKALEELHAARQLLSETIREIRNAIETNGMCERQQMANEIFLKEGYEIEPLHKLQQWGVMSAEDDNAAKNIIYSVIDYRRDPSLHHAN